jgi:cytidylate kinase
MNRIITIGREFGSGGREIGRRLAEHLHFAYYDQEIVKEIAKRTDMAEEYIRNIEERQPIPLLPITIGRTFTLPPNAITDQAQTVYAEQCKAIREMAQKSDCVIVGRCADYVLRELSPFRLFIYADMKSKIERCRKKGQEKDILNNQELQRKILSVDKSRSKYYQFYTDQVWGDKKNYDLCINTSAIEIKKAVYAIEKFLPFEL